MFIRLFPIRFICYFWFECQYLKRCDHIWIIIILLALVRCTDVKKWVLVRNSQIPRFMNESESIKKVHIFPVRRHANIIYYTLITKSPCLKYIISPIPGMMTTRYRIVALATLATFLRSISAFALTSKEKFPSDVSTLYSRREQCSTSKLPNRRDFSPVAFSLVQQL